jgi:hypothetical protein
MHDPKSTNELAPTARLMGEVNDARLPWWRREWHGVPKVLWIGLIAAGGFALYLHFKFPPF